MDTRSTTVGKIFSLFPRLTSLNGFRCTDMYRLGFKLISKVNWSLDNGEDETT